MRKIIHIDMDAFYASVEQRDTPRIKGKPVIVGGDPHSRGVVSACSYEARKFGVHSAMPCSKAYALCPKAVFVRPRMNVYRKVSANIREIFYDYTDLVEPLSLDEAYLDVTVNKKEVSVATEIAKDIKKRIFETENLTASAGVSFNKFLAKVASDYNKPNGITIITPELADAFISSLPIRKFFGVGRVAEKKFKEMGIENGEDLKKMSKIELVKNFGRVGEYYYSIAHGEDNRPVEASWTRKSFGREKTFHQDILSKQEICGIMETIAEQVSSLLKKNNIKGRTITVKIKYHDFELITRSVTINQHVSDAATIMKNAKDLLLKTEVGKKKVRLVGIAISNLDNEEDQDSEQLYLPFR